MANNTTQGVVLAIFGASAGGHLTSLNAAAEANGLSALADDLSAAAGFILGVDLSDDATFTSTVLSNLGIEAGDGYDLAEAYFTSQLAGIATRGEVVAAAVEYLLGDTVDASLADAATAFETTVTDAVAWSTGDGASVLSVAELQAQQSGEEVPDQNLGSSFTLTSSTDGVSGTAKNDTITAETGSLQATDVIIDSSSDDNDVLNLALGDTEIGSGTAVAATIEGIEEINVNLAGFGGDSAGDGESVDASNIKGATITISSDNAGFDGVAGVAGAGKNAIVAGAGVTEFNVVGLKSAGSVSLGSSVTQAYIEANATTEDLSLTLNGGKVTADIGVTTAFNQITINTAADTELTNDAGQTSANQINFEGDGKLTLKATNATGIDFGAATQKLVNNGSQSVLIEMTTDDDLDLTAATGAFEAKLLDTYSSTVTMKSGSTITAKKTLGTATFDLVGSSTTGELNIVAGGDIGAITTTGVKTTNIEVSKNIALGTVADTNAGTLNLSGTGDVTVATSGASAVFDATELNGRLIFTTGASAQVVTGGQKGNTFTAAAGINSSYTGQDAADTFDLSAGTSGTLVVNGAGGADTLKLGAQTAGSIVANLGAGDDTVNLIVTAVSAATDKVVVDGGDGTDTLKINGANGPALGTDYRLLKKGSDFSGIENLTIVEDTADAGAIVGMHGSLFDGSALTIKATDSTDVLLVGNNAAASSVAQTIDFSGVTYDAANKIDNLLIEGGAGKDVIVGSSTLTKEHIDGGAGDDSITAGAGAGADIIVGAGGNDTIDLTGATGINTVVFEDTAANNGRDSIVGWGASDVLEFGGYTDAAAAAVTATSGSTAVSTASVAAKAAMVDETVYVISTDGSAANLTLQGTATVSDWEDLSSVAAYLDERFTVTATEGAIFVVNDTTSDMTYVYDFVDVGATIERGELTIIADIDNGGTALSIGNISVAGAGALIVSATGA